MILKNKKISLSYFLKNKKELANDRKKTIHALIIIENFNIIDFQMLNLIFENLIEIYDLSRHEIKKYFTLALKKDLNKYRNSDQKLILTLKRKSDWDSWTNSFDLFFKYKTDSELKILLKEIAKSAPEFIIYEIYPDEKYLDKKNRSKYQKIKNVRI